MVIIDMGGQWTISGESQGHGDILHQLLGVDVDVFKNEVWERAVCHQNLQASAPLLSLSEIDRILLGSQHQQSNIRLVKDGSALGPEEYTTGRISALGDPTRRVSMDRVLEFFEQGYSIVLRNVGAVDQEVRAYCSKIGDAIGAACRANLYVTPPGSKALSPHYDSHCVICHQLVGMKHWTVFDDLVELATPALNFHKGDAVPTSILKELELLPGDSMYIPRGVYHAARASSSISAHLTFGLHILTVADYLRKVISILELDDPSLRRRLDIGSLATGEQKLPVVEEIQLRKLLGFGTRERAFAACFSDLALTATNIGGLGRFSTIAKTSEISAQTMLRRSYFEPIFIVEGTGALLICLSSGTYSSPTFTREAFAFALRTEAFLVDDLPGGLSSSAKITFVTSLVRWGLLEVVTDQSRYEIIQ